MFFFFQAEDGIRDSSVTGVQTCALPSLWRDAGGGVRQHCGIHGAGPAYRAADAVAGPAFAWLTAFSRGSASNPGDQRSGEGRVGNEWRSRWSAYPLKKRKREMESQ